MLNFISRLYIFLFRQCGITIGSKARIWPAVFVAKGFTNGKSGAVTIGKNCELCKGAVLRAYGGKIELGNNTFIGEYAVIYGHGGVTIGEHTLIAMHTCIVSSNHTVPGGETLIRSQPDVLLPVVIGSDVWVGAGAKILGGVTIGNGCVIGAGAVVTKSMPPNAIATGIPAHITGYRHE